MCFDIDVHRLTMEELRDTLGRVTLVLSRPNIVNNLPDLGHQLRQAKVKLEREIEFRESLEQTRAQIQRMSIRCASDSNLAVSHTSRVCSFDRKPERERFKPHFSLKPSSCVRSHKSESMKELRSGVKMLDLITSMSLQKKQEERVKSEQIKSKHERLMAYMMTKDPIQNESDSDDSSEPTNFGDDYEDSENSDADDKPSADEKQNKEDNKPVYLRIDVQAVAVYDIDEPGPSHITVTVPKREVAKPKRRIQLVPCPSEPKVKAENVKDEAKQAEKKPEQEGDQKAPETLDDQQQKMDQEDGDPIQVKQEAPGTSGTSDVQQKKMDQPEADQIKEKQDAPETSDIQQQKMDQPEGDQINVKQEMDQGSDEQPGESQVYAGPSKIREEIDEDQAGTKKIKFEVAEGANLDDKKPGLP